MNFSIKISELKTIFVILLYNILLFTPVVTMGVDTSIVPQLQRVTIKTDSVIYEDNSPLDETTQNSNYFPNKLKIPHRYNSLTIIMKNPELKNEVFFQYYLKDFDKSWSKPVRYPIKEYSNLPPGKYTFNVRYSFGGKPGTVTSFHFKVLKPVFKTYMAMFIYLTGTVLFIIVLAKFVSYGFARERFRWERIINDRTNALVMEKDKSENLLANVLPKDTARELKVRGKVAKKKYDMVTVLFSDIQGFTKLAEQMNPETLIDELDHFFFYFDSVVEKYNIEKIKTIGDAYMCAGGIPVKNKTNPVEVVMAALEMQQYMIELHKKATLKNTRIWDIRIGIHTGPVIAGVVGHKKLSYDIWGDTVNTASRMESSGEAGKINISGSTYELIKGFFDAEYRGKMPVKYKGEIEMYFVKGLKTEYYSKERNGPNKKFFNHLHLLRLSGFREIILQKVQDEISENYYFHNLDFMNTLEDRVDAISSSEGVGEDDVLLIKSAAYLYVTGFVLDYNNPQEAACNYAKDILPGVRYSESQIKTICSLVKSVPSGGKPKNLNEGILKDAIYFYVSSTDYLKHSMNLFHELKDHQKIKTLIEWKVEQTGLISGFEYFTETARNLREVDKNEQLKKVIQLMETNT